MTSVPREFKNVITIAMFKDIIVGEVDRYTYSISGGILDNSKRGYAGVIKFSGFINHISMSLDDDEQIPPINILAIGYDENNKMNIMRILDCELMYQGYGATVIQANSGEELTFIAKKITPWGPLETE